MRVEGTDNGPLEQLAYKFKSYQKAGKPIRVFVNSDKPCEAIADRTVHWSKLTTLCLCLLCCYYLVVASCTFYLRRERNCNGLKIDA